MLMETDKNCSELRWSNPVVVKTGHGAREHVLGPQDALNCLTHRWTEERGPAHERARHLCMAALGRRIPVNNVRDAFIAACGEADMLVPGAANDPHPKVMPPSDLSSSSDP